MTRSPSRGHKKKTAPDPSSATTNPLAFDALVKAAANHERRLRRLERQIAALKKTG